MALAAVLVVAFALRVWGAFYDLPYIFHPDEPVNLQIIQGMLANHDPDPHAFLYPSLMYYVNVAAALIFVALPGALTGHPAHYLEPLSIAMGSTFAPDAHAVAMYRLVSICGGVLAVFLMYRVGVRARDRSAGLIAAALMAVSPLIVEDCRHVTPDSYVVLFELLTLVASLAILSTGRLSAYAVAGIAIGLTSASKYNGAVVCLFPIVAHLARNGFSLRPFASLFFAGVISAATFFAICPYLIIDRAQFLHDLDYQRRMYSSSHAGMEGHALTWYFGELIVSTGLALLLAALQIIDGIRRRSAVTWIIAVFAVTYFVFISLFQIRNDRTLLPVIPCVLALAAMFVVRVARDDDLLRKRSPKTRQALAAVCLIAMIVTPLGATVSRTLQLTRLDSRTTARVWMDANLPEHAIVAVESYSPYVDYRRFHIVYAERAIDHPPQWYFDQGVNFLVLNQGMYGRYLTPPYDHMRDTAAYLDLMKTFPLVKQFNDGGYGVQIYKVTPSPP
ncbi:MAG TPA: glycosyltransferase family 39 protein [Rudaea sp.]|jgi:4-amino-4-deoxy-L-arabinose transferase-like glycosyltransferase|nr:glycosyltransferase family 39 protein [Rudaea sp.]